VNVVSAINRKHKKGLSISSAHQQVCYEARLRMTKVHVWTETACTVCQEACRCNTFNTTPRICFHDFILSINTQFSYFVRVDGREKLSYCKVLVKPLASDYVYAFETSCLMTVIFLNPSCFPMMLKEFMFD
jgi:hypothetical protein